MTKPQAKKPAKKKAKVSKKASAKGKHARRKGSTFERYVAQRLREVFKGAKRKRQSNTYDNRIEEPDVEAGPFDVECKHKKNVSRKAAVDEARLHARLGRHWCAVIREHGSQDVEITMELTPFLDLCQLLRSRQAGDSEPDWHTLLRSF